VKDALADWPLRSVTVTPMFEEPTVPGALTENCPLLEVELGNVILVESELLVMV
jgi:hypothetical protein